MAEDNATDTANALISINPQDTLTFQLERNTNVKSLLRITNISNRHVAFKVKTTQPSWYFVRPNQSMIAPGASEDVVIALLEAESSKLLDQYFSEPRQLDKSKHRFLVQSKAIGDDESKKLLNMSNQMRFDEYSKIWDSKDSTGVHSVKLKVGFIYPESDSSKASVQSIPTSPEPKSAVKSVKSNAKSDSNVTFSPMNQTPNTIAAQTPSQSVASGNANTANSHISSNQNTSKTSNLLSNSEMETLNSLKADFEQLKKRFDAVVEYTVHLTGERDAKLVQLEKAQMELENSRKNNKKSMEKDDNGSEANAVKKRQSGFSLSVILIIAFVFFAMGRFSK